LQGDCRSIVTDPEFRKVKDKLKELDLVTVCEEAKCPNVRPPSEPRFTIHIGRDQDTLVQI